MFNFYNPRIILIVLSMGLLLTGCASNSIKQVDSQIAEKAILEHVSELKAKHGTSLMRQIPGSSNHKIKFEWVQPDNKSENCLVYRDYINHYSKKSTVAWDKENSTADYQLLWDGLCKDGYASGLGREIEQGKGISRYTLSRYSSESRVKPVRYIQEDYLNGNRREGDLNNHIYVDIDHYKKLTDLELFEQYGLKRLKKGDKMMENGNIVTLRNEFTVAPYNPFGIEDVLGIDIKPISNGKNQILTYGFIGSDISCSGGIRRETSTGGLVKGWKASKVIQIRNLDRAILCFISYNDNSNVSFNKSVFESQNLLQRGATYNNEKGNNHGLSYSKSTIEPGAIFERSIETFSLWNDGNFLGVIDKVDDKIKEEYFNFLDLIEKDSSDLANLALVNRIASLDAKKEYMDSICTENGNNNFCKKEDYDENLNKYIAMIKNIRAVSETFKPIVVALSDKNMEFHLERSAQGPNFLADLASSFVTLRRINKMQSNIIKAKREEVRRSGLSASQIKLSDNDIRLGGNSSGLKKYYQDGGFGGFGGFNNKSNKPNLNYYCNTYADDYVCNPSLMKKRYSGSSGSGYKYDLSNPFDRSIYSTDVGAQINDAFSSDRLLDQGLGQFGGGID